MKTYVRSVVLVAGISLCTWTQAASAQETTTGGAAVEVAPAPQDPSAPADPTAPPSAPIDPPAAPATLQTQTVALTRTQTKSVQRRVKVRPDGVVGSGTRRAIKRFQTKQELTKTGRPNIETLRALKLKLADKLEAKLALQASAGPVATTASATGAIAAARSQFGVPYRSGGTTTAGFDCSGLMLWAFKQAGVTLPRTSFEQYREGVAVEKADIQAGDLVFFNTAGAGASHVGIATSATTVISATTGGVKEHKLNDSYWGSHYVGARRLAQTGA